MPPVILWALGALGAAVVVRLLVREGRRINAELHPDNRASVDARHAEVRNLVQDPVTGIYRPK
jgi:hypothetical protein